MLAKVIAWGIDRNEALERIKIALGVYQISGGITNIPAFKWVLKQKQFLDGTFDINFIDNEFLPLVPNKWRDQTSDEYEEVAAVLGALLKQSELNLTISKNKVSSHNYWNSKTDE